MSEEAQSVAKQPARLFISYTAADLPHAEQAVQILEGAGHRCIYQHRDFPAGSNFVEEMHRALQKTRRTVAIISTTYLESRYCTDEWTAAFATQQERPLPIRVEPCQPDGLLGPIVYVDWVGPDGEPLSAAEQESRLLAAMASEPRPIPVPPEPRPWLLQTKWKPLFGWLGGIGLFFYGVLEGTAIEVVKDLLAGPSVYTVSIGVRHARGTDSQDVKVVTQPAGELKHVPGGWEAVIRKESLPAGGILKVTATRDDSFEEGQAEIPLGRAAAVSAAVELKPRPGVQISGSVFDSRGKPLPGATVWVNGEDGRAKSSDLGGFRLLTRKAFGQGVEVLATHPDCGQVRSNELATTRLEIHFAKCSDVKAAP